MKHSPVGQGDTPGKLYDLVNNQDSQRTYGAIKSRFIRHITPILTQTRYHPTLMPSTKLFAHSLGEFLWLKEQQASDSELEISCLAEFHFHLARWQPNPGRIGRELPSLVDALLAILKQPGNGSGGAWKTLSNQITEYANAHRKRSDALESRQRDSIKNQEQFERSRVHIGAAINQALIGADVSHWFQVFIQKHLFPDLTRSYYIDPDSNSVKGWLSALTKLHCLFQDTHNPTPSSETRQIIYAEGPLLLDSLNESLYQDFTNKSIYLSVIERLTELIISRIKLQTINLVPYRLLTDSNPQPETTEFLNDAVSLPDPVSSRWFYLKGPNNTVSSGKIFHVNQQTKSIYVADYYGKRSLVISYDQYQSMLTEKKLEPIDDFMTTYHRQVRRFTEQELRLNMNKHLGAKDANDKPNTNTVQFLTDRLHQLNSDEDTSSAATKPSLIPKSKPELTAFNSDIENMQLGAQIRLKNDSGNLHKLTLKLPTADKFVFTDRLGEKSAEFTRADLVSLFQADELEIISSGQRFDSKLEEIVKNQR